MTELDFWAGIVEGMDLDRTIVPAALFLAAFGTWLAIGYWAQERDEAANREALKVSDLWRFSSLALADQLVAGFVALFTAATLAMIVWLLAVSR